MENLSKYMITGYEGIGIMLWWAKDFDDQAMMELKRLTAIYNLKTYMNHVVKGRNEDGQEIEVVEFLGSAETHEDAVMVATTFQNRLQREFFKQVGMEL